MHGVAHQGSRFQTGAFQILGQLAAILDELDLMFTANLAHLFPGDHALLDLLRRHLGALEEMQAGDKMSAVVCRRISVNIASRPSGEPFV